MACKNKSSAKRKTNILSGKEELVHNVNVGNMILNAFKSKPDFIGQIDAMTGEQITFRQMRENSVKCALWLQKTITYDNFIITICTSDPMLAYIPFLAGLYVGAIINPWEEKYFDDVIRLMYFLREYESEVIFVDNYNYELLIRTIDLLNNYEAIINTPKIITFGKIENVKSLESILNDDYNQDEIDKYSCDEVNPMNITAIMFSPNATNYPGKAHIRYLAFTYPSNQEVPAMSSHDIGLWYGSLAWTHSLILTVRSIVSYVTVIKSPKFDEEDMYNTIEKYEVTWVFLTSSMCNQLFKIDIRMFDVSSLKQFVFSDFAVYPDIYKKLITYFTNASVTQVYSISEACIIATYQRSNDPIASSGYLANNMQLMTFHLDSRNIVGARSLGEIWYRLMCRWCDAKTCQLPYCSNYQTKKKNIDSKSFAAITSTWHCTGDYGYYEDDGKLFIIDKIKHLIKYKMFYIPSQKIENVLKKHPAVSEVSVISVPNNYDGQHPRAYIKKKDEVEVSAHELEEFVAEKMPNIYQLRGGVYFTTEMPYLPNGKIDRALVQHW